MSKGFDYARTKTTLVGSKTQTSNPALYQAIHNLIDGVKATNDFIDKNLKDIANQFGDLSFLLGNLVLVINDLASNNVVYVFELDSSAGPISIDLEDNVQALSLFKDAKGTAGTNPITLTGTVEGVVDPVIDEDFGYLGIYKNPDGFFVWNRGAGVVGSGSPGTDVDHLATVISERASYVSGGGVFASELSILDIAIGVANALVGIDGAGLLEKTTGDNIAAYSSTTVSISRICYPDGTVYKILTDAGVGGANGATWVFDGNVNPSRYVHV